jgi:hypothetical protein
MQRVLLPFVLAAVAVWLPATARATVIEFEVTNVAGDVWQYDYFVDGTFVGLQEGFAVYFDETLYADLVAIGPSPADWDVLVLDPIVALQSDGIYDALALVDNPTFSGPFSVAFTWLGAGIPGSQPFEKYALDGSLQPVPIESGDTVPLVPEPATFLLLATGGVITLRRMRASHR